MPMAKALDIQAHYLMLTHLAKPTISHFCILGSKGPKNIYISQFTCSDGMDKLIQTVCLVPKNFIQGKGKRRKSKIHQKVNPKIKHDRVWGLSSKKVKPISVLSQVLIQKRSGPFLFLQQESEIKKKTLGLKVALGNLPFA